MSTDIEIRHNDYLLGGIIYIKRYSTVVANKKIGNEYTYLYNNGPLTDTSTYKNGFRNGKSYHFNENNLSMWTCDASYNKLGDY